MFLGIDFQVNSCGIWVPKWSQVGTKMESNIDVSKNKKNAFGASPLVPNWVQGVQVGSKNQPKIDPKMESKMECISASIFYTCQWILGGKLGGKIDQKSIQKGLGVSTSLWGLYMRLHSASHWFFNVFGRFLGGCHAPAIPTRRLSDPLKQTKHHWNWANGLG